MKNLPGGIIVFGMIALVLTLSTSCMMMRNMCMPMNYSANMMVHSQPDTLGITDPVCETQVDTSTALTFNYGDNTYNFDSEECLKVFQKNPEKFIKRDMKIGEEKSKKRMNSAVMMGGAAMVAMMVIMIPVMLLGGGH